MDVGKEASRVIDNLLNLEASTLIETSSSIGQASDEGTFQAARGHATLVITDWIGERNARRSSFALCSLVNMSCCAGRRLVISCDAKEGYILEKSN